MPSRTSRITRPASKRSLADHLSLLTIRQAETLLGLAEPPPELDGETALSDEQLVARAIAEREERAATEKMRVQTLDPSTPWTDYTVSNKASGKTYRVALRGWQPGQVYCSCPDFRKNTLGLCKHTLQVAAKVRRRFPAKVRNTPWKPDHFTLSVTYGSDLSVRLEGPARRGKIGTATKPWLGRELHQPADFRALLETVRQLEQLGETVTIYPDARELLSRTLDRERVVERMTTIRKSPADHPLRESLLKVPLLPYQLDGIAFATQAVRDTLAQSLETDAQGRPQLTLTLPDQAALDRFAEVLGKLVGGAANR